MFATVLWLVLATEAHADDGSASSDSASAAVDTVSSSGSGDDPAQEPVEQAPVDPAPLPEPEPLPPEPTPVGEGPATDPPPAETPPTVGETPPPEPQPPPPPVVEPSPAPEPPVAISPPEVPGEPPLPAAPVEVPPATGSNGESIVTIPQDSSPLPPPPPLPLLFPSDVGGPAAVTWAGDRLDRQSGSRSETRDDGARAAGRVGNAPLPRPLPFKAQAPSRLFASAGGLSGGSSGGFSVGVHAALIALLAVAAQLLGSLVSVRLAPPRGNAFALRLIRPG